MSPSRTAVVVGGGPAGRGLAHRLRERGVSTTLVDPHPDRTWRATYAAWTDELPNWLSDNTFASQMDTVAVSARTRREIARGYTVLDNAALAAELDLDGVALVTSTATSVSPREVVCADGSVLHAEQVIDCRGALPHDAPYQTAFGIVVDARDAEQILDGAGALLMEWTGPRQLGAAGSPLPSFLYAVPLGDGTVLLEETCLAGHPALPLAELHHRLLVRLGDHYPSVLRTESVNFPLVGASTTPWKDPVFRFGAAGGLTHPTTGYSVAASWACADLVAAALAEGADPVAALWPTSARLVHDLRLRGLSALLGLSVDETLDFFEAFFTMPISAQRSYLSGRDDLAGTLEAMGRVISKVGMRTRLKVGRGAVAGHGWVDVAAEQVTAGPA